VLIFPEKILLGKQLKGEKLNLTAQSVSLWAQIASSNLPATLGC
jgi:hypothetical protein